MTIKEFIEKAIKGGWEVPYSNWEDWIEDLKYRTILDSNAWSAVGKSCGWGYTKIRWDMAPSESEGPEWLWNMHRMIDSLAEGKSLEEFLATL